MRVLILGGTTEARRLAALLAADGRIVATLSLAGRTEHPAPQPLPTRVGGFGGADGLAAYLTAEAIDVLVDATHPFAERISANAATASAKAGVPLLALERPAWTPVAGDQWIDVPDLAAAAEALGAAPRRVFLTTGRLGVAAFKAATQHRYLLRSIDPPDAADLPPDCDVLLARGPFTVADEVALMRREGVEIVVTKNSGAVAAVDKLAAARALGLPVVMIARAARPEAETVATPEVAHAWLLARAGYSAAASAVAP
jgi:precorrin-6A/cobalt-precorrin-6A reductase